MLMPITWNEMSDLKHFARITLLVILVSLFSLSTGQLITSVEHGAFSELLQGFAELFPSVINAKLATSTSISAAGPLTSSSSGSFSSAISTASGSVVDLLSQFSGLALFSVLSLLATYRISGAGRVVILVQLVVLSLVYQVAVWQFFHVEGHPASLIASICLSGIAGALLKQHDYEKHKFESQQIELKLRNEQLEESRLALVKQDESERRLLAADLHDQVLNDLRMIQKRFEQFAENPKVEERDAINVMMRQNMSQIREIMDDLCPATLEEFGLSAAIEERLDKSSELSKFKPRFSSTAKVETIEKLSSVEKLLIYRLVQESLTNISKHANASRVRITIAEENGVLIFSVNDDGRGIDADMLSASSRGTMYMRLRAALIGAKVDWKQGPDGKGTTVEIRMHVQGSGS